MTDLERRLVDKIDKKEKLTEGEVCMFLCDCGVEVDEIEGDSGRWTKGMETIIQIDDRFFCVYWEAGLTEYQDNFYYNQPEEVRKVTYEKTITVTEWVSV